MIVKFFAGDMAKMNSPKPGTISGILCISNLFCYDQGALFLWLQTELCVIVVTLRVIKRCSKMDYRNRATVWWDCAQYTFQILPFRHFECSFASMSYCLTALCKYFFWICPAPGLNPCWLLVFTVLCSKDAYRKCSLVLGIRRLPPACFAAWRYK